MRQAYPFTLGANIGTCVTALLASLSITGDMAAAALQIALVHLIYNTSAVVIIYGIPFLRELPLKLAEFLANKATENKIYGLAYTLTVFFILPGILLSFT